eukprot:IDg22239t1
MKWVREQRIHRAQVEVTRYTPSRRRIASAAAMWKHTNADTGFPGSETAAHASLATAKV